MMVKMERQLWHWDGNLTSTRQCIKEDENTALTNKSVVMSTRLEPERNSFMMTSLSFWSMSPCYKMQVNTLNKLGITTVKNTMQV